MRRRQTLESNRHAQISAHAAPPHPPAAAAGLFFCAAPSTPPLPFSLLTHAQNKVASKGRGILAMDESNATCGKRLESIGLENTEDNRCGVESICWAARLCVCVCLAGALTLGKLPARA